MTSGGVRVMELSRRAFAGGVVGAAALGAIGVSGSGYARAQEAGAISVLGEVAKPTDFTLEDLAAMSPWNVVTAFPEEEDGSKHAYDGPPLFELIQACEPTLDETNMARACVVVTGADGYASVFSWVEIAPDMGQAEVIVALKKDGSNLEADQLPARVVSVHDLSGLRSVWAVRKIEVRLA